MDNTTLPDSTTDLPWPSGDHRMRVADTSMLPGSDKAPTAAVGMLNHAVQGAHDSIDRLAAGAAPGVRQLGERVSAAQDTLHAKAEQWRAQQDEWAEGLRATVRSHPLKSVVAALALGAVIARVIR
ncbi:MAG: hypothetical protein CFE45_24095 [Burkholderiales bacterium PBB5]|nr:MAG: hypothetical protein CFE45_24095 [Burkholderiales bacterium PBB5]